MFIGMFELYALYEKAFNLHIFIITLSFMNKISISITFYSNFRSLSLQTFNCF